MGGQFLHSTFTLFASDGNIDEITADAVAGWVKACARVGLVGGGGGGNNPFGLCKDCLLSLYNVPMGRRTTEGSSTG